MFVMPGPPWRRKTGSRRVRRAGVDARDRQRDQPRLRVGPVLGHDERAAVGGVAALLGARSRRTSGSGRRPSRLRARRPRRRRSEPEVARDRGRRARRAARPAMRRGSETRRFRASAAARPAGVGLQAPARARAPPSSSCGSHSSHLGRYQFQSPSSFIVAGRSTARTIVASMQDRRREPDAELLEEQHRERAEDREDGDHHDRGAGDDAGRRLDPVRDRLVRASRRDRTPRGSG